MTDWPVRDDLPVVLVTLDGLGDRPCIELGGRTPAEAAITPVLDALVTRGANGVHVPFGPGRATSSERSHWEMFGLGRLAFPGRAALELLGVGGTPPSATPLWHLAVRRGDEHDGVMRITGRLGRGETHLSARAQATLEAWADVYSFDGIRFGLEPIRTGEWALFAHGAVSHEVSDSDPLFEHRHPWMRPLPLAEAVEAGGERASEAKRSSRALEGFLLGARSALMRDGVEFDVPTTKWGSRIDRPMSFTETTGATGVMVTSSALYRGLARLLQMQEIDIAAAPDDIALGLAHRVDVALELLDRPGTPDLIHVHTKAPDEAGHTKDPRAKVRAIEACDAALAPLLRRLEQNDVVLAITGDHATPSETMLLHSGDPTPFIVAGPDVRADDVERFGETPMLRGSLGRLAAADISPLLHSEARRPFFLGHRPGPALTSALAAAVPAMPLTYEVSVPPHSARQGTSHPKKMEMHR